MSICATLLELLVDTGHGIEEAILVAEAMERGPDRDEIYAIFYEMEPTDCPIEAISAAIIERSRAIIEANAQPRPRQSGPATPNPYQERLGLSRGAWLRLRETIFTRDGRECRYCGATDDLAIDHIVPLSRGGSNEPDNLTPACKPCNSSKRDKLLEEWMGTA